MNYCRNLFIAIIFLNALLIPISKASGNKAPAAIDIPRISGEITIDANFDEPQWKNAKRVLINNITRPFDNIPSQVHTEALLMENGETLFIAFTAQDPEPEKIRAFLKNRDKVWGDDIVGIKIDTYNDQRSAYRFLVNPLGVKIDGIESEVTKKESDAWDGIWDAAGQITCDGYRVEIALPLRILNFNEKSTMQDWGIELVRFYPREEFMRLSNIYLDRDNSCELCQLATAKGFEGVKQGNNFTLTPSVVTSQSDYIADNSWTSASNKEASLDLRWGITPDILLNTTLNPDFSTIESDNAQLNINNNFALYNQEKRPFFLDNADYFDSNYNLVYTRNINAPNYGAKLSARKGDHTLGLFVTDDDSTNILIPGNRASALAQLDSSSNAAALRYRYNYNQDTTLGWISTLRTADDYNNQVHGFDARVKLSTYDVVKFQNLYSTTQYPSDLFRQFCQSDDMQACQQPSACNLSECQVNETVLRTLNDDSFSGNAFRAGYYHNDSDWFYRVTYDRQNSGFRGDLGFISHVDYQKFSFGGDRKWYGKPGQWWNKFKIYSDWDTTYNDNNEMIEREFDINAQLNASYDSYLRLGFSTRDKVGSRIDKSRLALTDNTTLFNEKDYFIHAGIKPVLGLSLHTNITIGDAIDYSNNRLGDKSYFHTNVNWNLNKHLELKLKQTYSRLDANNANVFIARLTDFRAIYQFNVKSFLRMSFIYNNTDKNAENYLYTAPEDITEKRRNLSTELLYAYKINAQTVFYLGLTNNQYTTEGFGSLALDQRNIFTKFSYAWMP
ncbi:DUF5916 domain-containing protein [Thalassotalea ganghwensis]